MQNKDIRWHQRLENFKLAFSQLQDAHRLSQQRPLSDLENQGVIQSFEYTHELAWNVLKDYFEDQGFTQITGSKDAARHAFQKGLIVDGHLWMEMIKSRNQTSHTYNKKVSQIILEKILGSYVLEFAEFDKKMTQLKDAQNA